MARIEAVLRRTTVRKRQSGVVCDRQKLICTVDGISLKLPRKEFEILALFLENPGRIFSREEVMQRIWKTESCSVNLSQLFAQLQTDRIVP